MAKLHLIKLSVGTESVETLSEWQQVVIARNRAAGFGPVATHVTRMWPRREAELLAGGSIYWVIKGVVLARQRLLGLQERIDAEGVRRCALVLEPVLIRTAPQPRRAFQGWRYLKPEDAPRDLPEGAAGDDALPADLHAALANLGVL
ncbi:DUF1489 family protein [Rhodobacteraceae bacterium 2CG4]|uniref:DUF1489 family protein n=1 Tax=Halovulum marinum TaxID=2662447 RepID=A0A6L5Z3I4_9RHOB|nr:DUF1489 domain-containing protein [Halovulum marinum]MSU91161.1 DUF1489 family protein [Halovulum marinum]